MMEFETLKVLLNLAYFGTVSIRGFLSTIPIFVDMIDDCRGVAIDKVALDAKGNY